ncbi:hypothetical protein [Saccharopolyspora hattusasensis]|uniref:hypothetical protein n=1 Tax=Saccharopolyspora hattusasensis TaxID=1128679 RepID=UPI003D96F885
MPMFLGPLGGLVEINPLYEFDMPSERFGGTHVSISGRRTVDVLGHRATFTLRWVKRDQDQMEFLEAIHHRLVPGPLRVVFPSQFRRNRLSRSAAAAGYGSRDTSGIVASGGALTGPADWQPASAFPARGLTWSSWTPGNETTFDAAAPAPVAAGEALTATLWVKSTAAPGVALVVRHVNAAGATVAETSSGTVTLTAGTWARLEVPVTPVAGAAGLVPALKAVSGSGDITIGGAQVELGAATQWTRGGGAPLVAVDQLNETALWSPYTNPELTLLEL